MKAKKARQVRENLNAVKIHSKCKSEKEIYSNHGNGESSHCCIVYMLSWVSKRTVYYTVCGYWREQKNIGRIRKLWLSQIQVLNCLKCQQFHASLLLLSFSLFCWLGQEQDKICWDITKSTEFHKIYWDLIKSTEITKSTKISWPDLTWHLENFDISH